MQSHCPFQPVPILLQVHFMVNNLTATDVVDRATQIQKAIWPEFRDWFANYLVVKRAAQVRSGFVASYTS